MQIKVVGNEFTNEQRQKKELIDSIDPFTQQTTFIFTRRKTLDNERNKKCRMCEQKSV